MISLKPVSLAEYFFPDDVDGNARALTFIREWYAYQKDDPFFNLTKKIYKADERVQDKTAPQKYQFFRCCVIPQKGAARKALDDFRKSGLFAPGKITLEITHL